MEKPLADILESEFLPFVEKPLRYVGNELNSIRKNPADIALHGVLCFPEVYDIGMSHFGIQILYHQVNSRPSWALSRCFHPWEDAEELMRKLKIPLYCLEYLTPLSQADWIGFSVQYELQYTNIVNMLDLAGLPVLSKDRDGSYPFVLAGGPCMVNPEPIADFVDAFAIGDGEETIVTLCGLLEEHKKNKTPKTLVLKALAEVPGVYVPAMVPVKKRGVFVTPDLALAPVRSAKIPDLLPHIYPSAPLVPSMNVVHHRLAIEVMRGCTRGCRFCSAGWYYRPVREREVREIFDTSQSALKSTGWRDVGLLSLSTADYSQTTELLYSCLAMSKRHIDVSLPSTRIDALTKEQADLLHAIANTSSFTLAPEAGSIRLRKFINKDFSDEAILDAVSLLLARNVQTLKLYFMIGLPSEEQADIDALVRIVEVVSDMARRRSPRRSVNVALSPFSPKAQTPFQWEAMESAESLNGKFRFVKQSLMHCRNVKIACNDPDMTFLETVMARGDRLLSALIIEAWKCGARSDGWTERFDFGTWKIAAEKTSVDLNSYVSAIAREQPLPWAAVSNGAPVEFLWEERSRAFSGIFSPDCRCGQCNGCGVCTQTTGNGYPKKTGAFGHADSPIIPIPSIAPKIAANSPENCETFITEEVFALPDATVIPTGADVSAQGNQSPAFFRITYEKSGFMRFLGHQDMMNCIHRAFTCLSFPISFSEGFHPHPRIAFGPPLPFGVSGQCELFDVMTSRQVPADIFMSANSRLPPGIKLHGSIRIASMKESLSIMIQAARYVFKPIFDVTEENLDLIARSAFAKEDVAVDASVLRGKALRKNIRPFIKSLGIISVDGKPAIEAILSLSPFETCRPVEFVAGVFPGRKFEEFSITRMEFFKHQKGTLVAV